MNWIIPGTTLEGLRSNADRTDGLFQSMFLAGGLSLSQVSSITGLETYTVQNWVKRGFLAPPQNKRYNMEQVCRIIIINMLKGALPLEQICSLLSYINGSLTDESDDIIDDSELYHRYTDMIADAGGIISHETIRQASKQAAADYAEPIPGARERLEKTLQVLAYAHYATIARHTAEETLAQLL